MTDRETPLNPRVADLLETTADNFQNQSKDAFMVELERTCKTIVKDMDEKSGIYLLICIFKNFRHLRITDALRGEGTYNKTDWWLAVEKKIGEYDKQGLEFYRLEHLYHQRIILKQFQRI